MKRLPLVGMLLLALIAAGAFFAPRPAARAAFRPDPEFGNHPAYRAAMATARCGDYAGAAAAFGALADADRRSELGAWSRYQQGICNRKMGRSAEASLCFRTVAAEYPEIHVSRLAQEQLEPRAAAVELPERDPDCGPKALQRGLRALGKDVPLRRLAALCRPRRDGCSFADLGRAARACGVRSHGVRVTAEGLRRERGPAVAWVDRNHFVTVLDTTEPLTIHDPAEERDREITVAEFERRWDGFLLVLEKGEAR